MQPIDGRALGAVDLGPFVAKAVAVISLGQRRPFPHAYGAAGELADERRPIVDIRRRARAAVGRLRALGETSDRARDARDRAQQILGKIDAMDRHVEQVAGAGLTLILSPTPAGLGQIEKPLRAKVPRLCPARRARPGA